MSLTEAAIATDVFTGKLRDSWWAHFDGFAEDAKPNRIPAARLHRELDRIVKRQNIAMDAAIDAEPDFIQHNRELDEPSRQRAG